MPRAPKPSNAPVGTVWFGGDVERVTVTLRLLGDDLDPDDVTALLGCEPTSAGRKGEPHHRNNRPRRAGVWLREHKPSPDATVDEAIAELLSALPQDSEFWQSLRQRFKIDLICDVVVRGANQGFELPPELLKGIAALGIPLGVDIFTEADEEQAALLKNRFEESA